MSCLDDETLSMYLSEGLDELSQSGLEEHLLVCDHCVASLAAAQRRLRLAQGVAVPSALKLRVQPVAVPDQTLEPSDSDDTTTGSAWTTFVEWLQEQFSPRLLVPAGVAALALFAIVQVLPSGSGPVSDGIRGGHQKHQSLRVSARSAALYSEASANGEMIVEVGRGEKIAVINERGDWYQVQLADGRQGWMERSDFD